MSSIQQKPKLPSLELLLDYLDGILDTQAAAKLQSRIATEEDLRATLEGIRFYYESVKFDREEALIYIQSLGMDFEKDTSSLDTSWFSQQPRIWWVGGIAASLLLLLTFGIYTFTGSSEDQLDKLVASALEEPYEAPQVFRGAMQNKTLLWENVHQEYDNSDYTTALEFLGKLGQIDQENKTVDFYTGLCYLYQEAPDYQSAIQSLKRVETSNHRLSSTARWFLSIAYLENGNLDIARNSLQKVVDDSSYGHKEGVKMLEILRSL